MRHLVAVFVAVLAIAAACLLAAAQSSGGGDLRVTGPDSRRTYPISLDGLNASAQAEVDRRTYLVAALEAERRRQLEAAAAAARVAEQQRRAATARPAITGTCAAMKPPGFPDWIIQRESGGDPNALNPSGAYGCAQLMPGTGGSGTYAERWARTWAGGAGACHWQAPNYCSG